MRKRSVRFEKRLTLGELKALTGFRLTGLLTFLLAGVTGEKVSFAERVFEFLVGLEESASDSELDRSDLAGHTATASVHCDIELVHCICHLEGVQDLVLERKRAEVIFESALVNSDVSATGSQGDSRGRGLAATGC